MGESDGRSLHAEYAHAWAGIGHDGMGYHGVGAQDCGVAAMMTRYIVIDPRAKQETVMHLRSFDDALLEAGLKAGNVDHGPIRRGVMIVVGMNSTMEQKQHFFSIDRRLYGGGAVLYGYDGKGETCDIGLDYCRHWFCRWYDNVPDIEAAIAAGDIDRPVLGPRDDIIWRWPEPPPSPEAYTRIARRIAEHAGTTIVDDVITTKSPTDG